MEEERGRKEKLRERERVEGGGERDAVGGDRCDEGGCVGFVGVCGGDGDGRRGSGMLISVYNGSPSALIL